MIMALSSKEIRELKPEEREEKLKELRQELMHERGVAAMGGSPPSPGKIKQLRTSIARLLTIMKEEKEKKYE
ncbi:MAG: 50S ribosomal protein L29 [Thermoplasmata archaeon]|nr:MAG: 50S ribosomal protein L29 [Thermoplasmata archaeon]HEB37065.1 50S ribosomal protein L29 [Thermoplasmatales archaeon]